MDHILWFYEALAIDIPPKAPQATDAIQDVLGD